MIPLQSVLECFGIQPPVLLGIQVALATRVHLARTAMDSSMRLEDLSRGKDIRKYSLMSADNIENTGHVNELGLSDRGIAVQAWGFAVVGCVSVAAQ